MFASSAVNHRFEPLSGHQTKDYNIDIWWYSAKYGALRSKSKNCLSRNRDNVFMSNRVLLILWASIIKKKKKKLIIYKYAGIVQSGHNLLEI